MFFCCCAAGKAQGQLIRAEAPSSASPGRESPRRASDPKSTKPTIGLGLATTASAGAFSPRAATAEDVPPTPLSVHEADAASGCPTAKELKMGKDDENPTKVLKKRNKRRASDDPKGKKRGSVVAMDDYLSKSPEASSLLGSQRSERPQRTLAGEPVTAENAAVGLTVVRGPKWRRGDEDGGPGSCGQIFAVDGEKRTLMVRWEANRAVHDHYGTDGELALYEQGSVFSIPSLASSQGAVNGACRNSQAFFADSLQTIIIYDWDDTLFPTTYVRDDMDFHWRTPLMEQRGLPRSELLAARAKLAACQRNVLTLLRDSLQLGKVVILTLARDPWVVESCKNFFPEVGELIESAKIPVVYAQNGVQVDYNKLAMSTDEAVERHWAGVKGRAIAKTVSGFYSQYPGQSWKNVISIGDSDFERLGTMQATQEYLSKLSASAVGRSDSKTPRLGSKTPTNAMRALKMAGAGLFSKTRSQDRPTLEAEVGGHVIKVRTKTFKMVDQPECDEVTTQVAMITRWLGLMVKLDEGFDVNLNELGNPAVLVKIERTLRSRGSAS